MNFLAFPSVKFRKVCQTGSKYLTLVGARVSGKSVRPGVLQNILTLFYFTKRTLCNLSKNEQQLLNMRNYSPEFC